MHYCLFFTWFHKRMLWIRYGFGSDISLLSFLVYLDRKTLLHCPSILIVKLLLYLKSVGYATYEINGDAYILRFSYPAPVHCNDNISETVSNQSTSDHNDSSNDSIPSSDERGCVGSKDVENFLIPSYYNKPDVDDICALKWGLHHYIKFFPSLRRPPYT